MIFIPKKIVGYEIVLNRFYCAKCWESAGLDDTDALATLHEGDKVDVIPACDVCGDDLQGLEEIEDNEEED